MGPESITIGDVRKATPREWDDVWWKCVYGTYFQSRQWAEIWASYTAGKPNSLTPSPRIITFSDKREALLPLSVQRRRGLVKHYFMSPEGTFGGWLSKDELSGAHARVLIDYLMKDLGNIMWRLNPYDGSLTGITFSDAHEVEDDETQVMDLGDGFDGICTIWSRGGHHALARDIRKAVKAGVTCAGATSEAEWEEYYRVYQASLLRWGDLPSAGYDWGLFQRIYRLASPYVKLWLAKYDNRVVAGALCFYARRHVAYWHGAALGEYFKVMPTTLVLYQAIKDACEKGYSWFDFNPSGGLAGVKAFKRNFGAEALPAPVVCQKTRFTKSFILAKKWCAGWLPENRAGCAK
jgi:hypothetical protein